MTTQAAEADSSSPGILDVLADALADHEAGWSMGSFGVLAEFHQAEGEKAVVDNIRELTRATERGAIWLDRDAVTRAVPVAYEQLSKAPKRWGQGLALCLPPDACRMTGRTALTRVGPDKDAIRAQDRDAVLFDMGLGLVQCDFHVRTSDASLIEVLSANEGRSLFEADNPSMSAILKSHPHRVAITPLGRIEVSQKIGGPDTGGRSPLGPHTHVLPKLMASGKTHAGNTTLPKDLIPCAYLHPGNPLINAIGEARPFEASLAESFDRIYDAFAPSELCQVKHRLKRAVAHRTNPAAFNEPTSRAGRIALRVGLRQLMQKAQMVRCPDEVELLKSWRRHFDTATAEFSEADEQADHHR